VAERAAHVAGGLAKRLRMLWQSLRPTKSHMLRQSPRMTRSRTLWQSLWPSGRACYGSHCSRPSRARCASRWGATKSRTLWQSLWPTGSR